MSEPEDAVYEPNRELVNRIIVLVIDSVPTADLRDTLTEQGLSEAEADESIRVAKERLATAQDATRREDMGVAIRRFELVYSEAREDRDHKTQLTALDKLAKLRKLYADLHADDGERVDRVELAELRATVESVAGYVFPLELIASDYPLEEHVRVACELIRQNQLAPDGRTSL